MSEKEEIVEPTIEELQAELDKLNKANKDLSKYKDDMLKYKAKARDIEAQLAAQKAEQEERERAAREANNEYKELYQEMIAENSNLKSQLSEKDKKVFEFKKLTAVKEKLGGFKKPVYNKFIDTDKIIIDNDGNVDYSTVDSEVERLKREYPELIKGKVASELPNEAPESGNSTPKSISELSQAERAELRRAAIESREKTKQQ